jgi:hypothetical protein
MLSFLQNTQQHDAAVAILVRIKILEYKGVLGMHYEMA